MKRAALLFLPFAANGQSKSGKHGHMIHND